MRRRIDNLRIQLWILFNRNFVKVSAGFSFVPLFVNIYGFNYDRNCWIKDKRENSWDFPIFIIVVSLKYENLKWIRIQIQIREQWRINFLVTSNSFNHFMIFLCIMFVGMTFVSQNNHRLDGREKGGEGDKTLYKDCYNRKYLIKEMSYFCYSNDSFLLQFYFFDFKLQF